LKSQRIPEHKLNTTETAGQAVENLANSKTTMPSSTGTTETAQNHTNEAK
jgi:hypothetical protein